MEFEEEQVLTQCTQPTDSSQLDPRRMGRNNSGLSDEDVGDVVVVLHPTTPAAFQLVLETARRSPQHVLQKLYAPARDNTTESSTLDEQQTFILENTRPAQGLDLAFRFSSTLVKPHLGFTFGRNPTMCDIPVTSDAHKRVSNLHFVIYVNESGVVMLRDISTNGTMVDDFLLKQKSDNGTRMLVQGTTIQILSPSPNEALKFVVRIPTRQGQTCIEDYERNFEKYMERQAEAKEEYDRENGIDPDASPKPAHGRHGNSIKTPLVHNTFGMHWNGGDTYNVVGHVGKGAFASVYQLATKIDGQLFAAKELEKRRFMKNGVLDRKLENEMHIMQSIDHRSVVEYHEYKDIANHLYIIMEFVPCGDLQQHLNQYGALQEHTAKQMGLQVLEALDYLHIKNITHRDIKPDNILIASRDPDNFIIKLSDFGLSKVVKDNDTFLKTFCGTLLYCAPEVFPHYDTHVGKGTKRPRKAPPQAKFHSYSQAVDIWSFGAVLWYSLCVKPPFEGVADNTGRGMFDKIMMTPLNSLDLADEGVSDEAVSLLVSMLNTDPKSRPSPADCLRSSWFADLEPVIVSQERGAFELGAIAEEAEGDKETAGEPDVAGLSLDENPSSQYSEVSLDDSDFNFFDPRQSKRFKTNDYLEEEDDDLLDSSPELFESIPIMHDAGQQSAASPPPKAPKLFGEISQSDLQSPAFGRQVYDPVGQLVSSGESEDHYSHHSQHAQPNIEIPSNQSPSLQGTEAMVREMKVQSAFPSNSENGANSGQNTPKTPPSFGSLCRSDVSHDSAPEITNQTPKPAQRVPFDRRINIGIPPSFFYDPSDPSTHNIEYASRVSGHDFAADPVLRRDDLSFPPAFNRSGSDGVQNASSLSGTKSLVSAKNAKLPGSRAVFGRLISTPDSFTKITIDLDRRTNQWGRNRTNTHSYHDKADVRVPKTAFAIFFHASGINDVPNEEDIRHLPGLYSGIFTYAKSGLKINGVQLDPMNSSTGEGSWGVLQTGDEIEVCSFGSKDCLKFRVEIYYGQSKKRRTKNGSKFTIEHEFGSGKQAVAGAEDEDDLYA